MATGPTLKDVADRAGVSLATASRALTPDQPISAATRDRVLAAVDALGYRARRARRSTDEVSRVVVLVPSLRHMAAAEVLTGVEAASADAGLSCSFVATGSDPVRELTAVERLAAGPAVAAVIAVGGTRPTSQWRESMTRSIRTLRSHGTRVVFCGRSLPDEDLGEVAVLDYENREGSLAAVSVLLSKGHRRIGLVRGPAGFSTSEERSQGYADALAGFDVELDPTLVSTGARSGVDAARRCTELLTQHPDLTAVFADSDTQAFGVLRAAQLLGRRVPEDLSVIGFDDHEDLAPVSSPPLTTVHSPFVELGRRATRAALGTDPELEPGSRLTLATHIVMRASVAPVAR
ncbi:MAG TPA: LacI family DNA-binding transcriptional regulator [Candidatus Avipropionibacterium avicola]|uniref:LacI family DNA-binding transcriptional regulator n=1 Tax=Candidatus Avipropionibacterium avicola TaxID=2840701 RepID=A0A9D1KKL3_9ACTN|nr:LacI family DNA-binding transcriptional regulator [Candidatus Avipropionibacterium avicola]